MSLARISVTFHEDADGRIAVHPVTTEDIPVRTLVVGLAPELQQNQTIHALIVAGAGLDSSDTSLVGLTDSDSNFAVAEQVIDPTGSGPSGWVR